MRGTLVQEIAHKFEVTLRSTSCALKSNKVSKVTTVPKDLMTMRSIVLMMTMVLRKVLTMTTLVMETLIMTRGPIPTLMKTGVFGGDGDELDSLAELWQGY